MEYPIFIALCCTKVNLAIEACIVVEQTSLVEHDYSSEFYSACYFKFLAAFEGAYIIKCQNYHFQLEILIIIIFIILMFTTIIRCFLSGVLQFFPGISFFSFR